MLRAIVGLQPRQFGACASKKNPLLVSPFFFCDVFAVFACFYSPFLISFLFLSYCIIQFEHFYKSQKALHDKRKHALRNLMAFEAASAFIVDTKLEHMEMAELFPALCAIPVGLGDEGL
jgi:cytochrome c biogenesis protein ResB